MGERVEHGEGFYESMTGEVPEDSEYVHVAVNPGKGEPTIEAGSLEALGAMLEKNCRASFDERKVYISADTPTLFAVYLPGPAFETGDKENASQGADS